MKKSLSCVFLTIMVVTGLMLVNTVYFRTVKASVNVTGVIGSDITWTKANSPYILTGNVLVGNGVTLTIEAGATVNLGSYYIMVNGTLRARGSVAEKVQSNGGSIIFTNYSSNWNEATGLGSIIENANLSTTSISIELAAPRIDSNSISAVTIYSGSVVISNNTITNLVSVSGSPLISNNIINGGISVASNAYSPIISRNTIFGGVTVAYGAQLPLISYNTIRGGLAISDDVNSPQVTYNIISGGIDVSGDSANVSYNTIAGGIRTRSDLFTILNNTIAGSNVGIDITPGSSVAFIKASIVNNTITARDTGINVPPSFITTFFGSYTDANVTGNIISNCSTAAIQVGGGSGQCKTI